MVQSLLALLFSMKMMLFWCASGRINGARCVQPTNHDALTLNFNAFGQFNPYVSKIDLKMEYVSSPHSIGRQYVRWMGQ